MSDNVVVTATKGRQPGQRVESLDLRAYRALLKSDPFLSDERITAIIKALRDADVF